MTSFDFEPIAFDTFLHWINERERIRLRRASGLPAPWTKDRILAEWRFCNVDRNDDRETRWIHKHIIRAMEKDDYITKFGQDVWFNLLIARFFNWAPTLEKLGWLDGSAHEFYSQVISGMRDRGEKIYTGAYMIRAGTGEDAKLTKEEYLWRRVFRPAWEKMKAGPFAPDSCAGWDNFFSTIFGCGDFMRNQVITDLKYTRAGKKYKDRTTFCLAGPGTTRGLNRLLDLDLGHKFRPGDANEVLIDLRRQVLGSFDLVVDPKKLDDLNNISNCCCEFDKYCRVLEGTGEPRAKFRPSVKPLP